ncbi:MAG: hypothetical protein ACTSYY_15390 [Promethearchaeota archaeon]
MEPTHPINDGDGEENAESIRACIYPKVCGAFLFQTTAIRYCHNPGGKGARNLSRKSPPKKVNNFRSLQVSVGGGTEK